MSRRTRRALVLTTAGGLSLLLAAPASAVVTVQDLPASNTVNITSDAASDPVTVSCSAGAVTVQGPTVQGTSTQACNTLQTLSLSMLAGDDRVDLRGVTTADFPALTSTTVSGGEGADILIGARGTVLGDGGNDRFIDPVATSINGGQGTNTIELDYLDAPDVATTFTVSDTAYAFNGATTPATLIDSYVLSLPDGVNAGSDVNASAYTGRVVARLHGGPDTFTGGSGNDFVDGGPGPDVINPGAGNDTVFGGDFDDVISTQDGQVDVIDCGAGNNDVVTADRIDVVKPSCETVNLPALPPPAPTPAPETSQVVGLKKVTRGVKASFVFVTSTQGAGFQCRLDNRAWRVCASPYKVNTRNLKVGKHKVFVRAALTGGNVDATPSKFGFRVLKPKKKR